MVGGIRDPNTGRDSRGFTNSASSDELDKILKNEQEKLRNESVQDENVGSFKSEPERELLLNYGDSTANGDSTD